MDERKKLLLMMREIRKKIDPRVLEQARQAALAQMGQQQQQPELPRDNEASRLFKLAREDNGARKSEILAYLEKKFRSKLN
tara:strand:+ start:1671 stop:1913 length:243 start_codon:yes stop_codon:yes gene_type:complete